MNNPTIRHVTEPDAERKSGEPFVPEPGRVITADSLASALTTYAKKSTNAEGGNYQDGEQFVVLGGAVDIDGEDLVGGSSAFGRKSYIPVVQLAPDRASFASTVAYVRIEPDEEMRKMLPRFSATTTHLTPESLVEVQGYFAIES